MNFVTGIALGAAEEDYYFSLMTGTLTPTGLMKLCRGARRELRTLLPLLEAIEIVGEAENGQSAIKLAAALQPDVILMDVEMPIVDGLAATRIIKQQCPACRIIVLSIHNDEAVRAQARSAGADDFVDKGAPLAALSQAIQINSTERTSS